MKLLVSDRLAEQKIPRESEGQVLRILKSDGALVPNTEAVISNTTKEVEAVDEAEMRKDIDAEPERAVDAQEAENIKETKARSDINIKSDQAVKIQEPECNEPEEGFFMNAQKGTVASASEKRDL
ncbi:hypothetical protein IWW34DRAFT_710446 [Fusarium oxysporum f. sp. albedinis]|nr:hypothetical protein IWW34DRAFT_710446 [Fusarium oxysporum f. sp. albedinis]KAJ0127009.1 Uncharacterized protein HZ326_29885 [Fusarium oxysporum f. sp. albedinis]KAK2470821.1 hypothetical protein H9L39_17052 [Fusarium oxysporum f. sp. albedinis]